MTVTVRYIGTSNPHFETTVTGKPGKWTPGDIGDVSDADAALLLATAEFEVYADRVLPFAFNAAGGIAGVRLPDGSIANVGGTFRGPYTWAARPLLGVTVGDTFRATDIGRAPGTIFIYTGSRWRRLYPFNLVDVTSSLAAPIQTITGVTSGTFTLPTPVVVPADLLAVGERFRPWCEVYRRGANATATILMSFGTAGTTSDGQVRSESISATNNRISHQAPQCAVYSATGFRTNGSSTLNGNATGSVSDVTTNVNFAAAMYLTLSINSANTADSFDLLGYGFEVL